MLGKTFFRHFVAVTKLFLAFLGQADVQLVSVKEIYLVVCSFFSPRYEYAYFQNLCGPVDLYICTSCTSVIDRAVNNNQFRYDTSAFFSRKALVADTGIRRYFIK